MVHKAFEVIGERVLIIDTSVKKPFDEKTARGFEELLKSFGRDVSVSADTKRNSRKEKLGIFLESEKFMAELYGGRAALDFIELLYKPSSLIEELVRGKVPREKVHSNNPILSICYGIDPLLLNYEGEEEIPLSKICFPSEEVARIMVHKFTGELWYAQGVFYNDGNFEVYDKYKEPLRRAGFFIK